ncbi:hypothetical protein PC119_g7104 [Phytophthora cactorum]|nr:hypothetical protein PC119_g7104 [Phytophthora cactorum]
MIQRPDRAASSWSPATSGPSRGHSQRSPPCRSTLRQALLAKGQVRPPVATCPRDEPSVTFTTANPL